MHQHCIPAVKMINTATVRLSVLILALSLSGCAPKNAGPPPNMAMPVPVQPITQSPVMDASEYQADLISRHSVVLQSQVDGQIVAINVKPGQIVHQGAELILVDPARQQAVVNSAEAQAEALKANIGEAQASLTSAKAQRQSALSNFQVNQKQYNRYTSLFQTQTISQQDLERYTDTFTKSQADLRTNQSQIQAQRAGVIAAEKNYQQAEAGVKQQQVQLRYYRISAPFSGMVGDIPVKLGNYIQPTTALVSVTENNPLEVNVNIPSEDSGRLKNGMTVDILSDSGAVLGHSRIWFISPRVDDQTQTILVKAYLKNPDSRFKADQFVRSRIIWRQTLGIHIPTSSVVHLGGQDFVYLAVTQGGKSIARQTPVTLGDIDGSNYVVKSGLQPNQLLVIGGIQKLQDGAPITPQRNAAAG